MKAGGSRKLPLVCHLRTVWTLGDGNTCKTFAGAARCQPTELPPSKAAPLQAVGNRTSHERATTFENEDDDEDNNDLQPYRYNR
jgi:hypothetical protein